MRGFETLIAGMAVGLCVACGAADGEPGEAEAAAESDGSYVENLGKAYHGGFAEGTRGDLRAIAAALALRVTDAGDYPMASDMEELAGLLEPHYIRTCPRTDTWGRGLHYQSDGSGYTLRSAGKNGVVGDDDDLVVTDAGMR